MTNWVAEQDNYEGIYCIVDMHALTVPESVNAKDLNKKVWDMTALYLAAGIDPKRSTILFSQWFLACGFSMDFKLCDTNGLVEQNDTI